jgi:hypothetical protein
MSNINEWPFPKLIVTPYRTLLLSKMTGFPVYVLTELRFVDGSWEGFNVDLLDEIGTLAYVDVADFGPFYSIAYLDTSGNRYNYIRDISQIDEYGCMVAQTQPLFGTHINFNGQLIGGNVSNWQSLGSNAIVWSAIGNYEFDPSVNIVAGFSELFVGETTGERATIYRLLQLGSKVIAYADAGRVILSPQVIGNTFTFGQERLSGNGIRSGNHLAGDLTIHGYINTENEFCITTSQGNIRRGYKEFIAPLISGANETHVSFLPKERTFYISNGISSLVVNEFGAYKSHQLPSSVVRTQNGVLYGTFNDTEDESAIVVTDSLDFGSRGIKTVEAIRADYSLESESRATAAADWRLSNNSSFTRSNFLPFGPHGEARIGIAASHHRLCVRFTNYESAELRYLLANVKYSDQRFKRGTVPKQYNTLQPGEA